jgi:ABC-2 type transport system permease protein
MKKTSIIALHFLRTTLRSKAIVPVSIVWILLVIYAGYTGYYNYSQQNNMRIAFQQQARQSWENNPDKHPHRMAHFGSFAFRLKHPLSMFDPGMESYTGNAVFLEAHKQNTVNFSDASFSTGLLRFGEISLSMLLQVLLPLILFFLGFQVIAQQKENGTLKMLFSQGCSYRHIVWGNGFGIFVLGILFMLPVLIMTGIQLINEVGHAGEASVAGRAAFIFTGYFLFVFIAGMVTVCVSALSNTSRSALLKLLGIWLLMVIVLPKTLQAIGSNFYPAPGKIAFEVAVENDMLKIGDSHNPDDKHFKQLKDSVLKANHADSVQQLSFNYSGFQMREGERLSAEVHNRHQQELYDTYERQNAVSYLAAFINPVSGIRNLSMAFSGADFKAYRDFQQQAETYRYNLAQTMNELQMKYISNAKPPDDKPHSIERSHWTDFNDFSSRYQSLQTVAAQQNIAIAALLLWLVLSIALGIFTTMKAKII